MKINENMKPSDLCKTTVDSEINMKSFERIPTTTKKNIQFVLTDIDDTLTNKGRLSAVVLWPLKV